ncbi:MAG: monovalent cation/H(+) antiporter subunit G [Desulfurococcaceae archaeon TW002]
MIEVILFYIGLVLTVIGGVLDVLASIGFFRFKDFYVRLHAATIGAIGGGFYPLIGLALISLGLDLDFQMKTAFFGVCVISAVLIAWGVPAGTHILARAAYRSREAIPQVIEDKLKKYLEGEKK